MTAAIYIRVSSSKKLAESYQQNSDIQLEPLKKLARERDYKSIAVYSDRMSGANPNRPQFRKLMEDAKRGKFQAVLVWKFDRFARSLKDLVVALDELNALGIRLISYTEAIDTSTPAGKALFQMAGIFAEFERSLVIERVQAGIEHARVYGTRSGQAIGRPRRVFNREKILELRTAGKTFAQIASELGIGVGTAAREHSRILAERSPDKGCIQTG